MTEMNVQSWRGVNLALMDLVESQQVMWATLAAALEDHDVMSKSELAGWVAASANIVAVRQAEVGTSGRNVEGLLRAIAEKISATPVTIGAGWDPTVVSGGKDEDDG